MSQRFKPFATVALIVEHNGKYLIVEEYNEDQDNRLVFGNPCGHIDARETILEAAIREGHEETGCDVELLSLVSIDDYVKDNETIYRFCFEAKLKDYQEKMSPDDPDQEILAVKWYTKTSGEPDLSVKTLMPTLRDKDALCLSLTAFTLNRKTTVFV